MPQISGPDAGARQCGAPFYADWGLTDDRVGLPRRTAAPSLEQLFAAVYFDNSHYISPVSAMKSRSNKPSTGPARKKRATGGGGKKKLADQACAQCSARQPGCDGTRNPPGSHFVHGGRRRGFDAFSAIPASSQWCTCDVSVRNDDAAPDKFLDNHVGQCFRRVTCTVEMDLRILGWFVW